jgi:RecA/RadA recombinase
VLSRLFVAVCRCKAALDNILLERGVNTPADLFRVLERAEDLLRNPTAKPVRLIIIDSVASVFRDVGDDSTALPYVQRTHELFRLSALLRRFADAYALAAVVTNQVTDALPSWLWQPGRRWTDACTS